MKRLPASGKVEVRIMQSNIFSCQIVLPDHDADVILGKKGMPPPPSIRGHIAALIRSEPLDSAMRTSEFSLEGIAVVRTPGHTPGSISYFLKSDSALFV